MGGIILHAKNYYICMYWCVIVMEDRYVNQGTEQRMRNRPTQIGPSNFWQYISYSKNKESLFTNGAEKLRIQKEK